MMDRHTAMNPGKEKVGLHTQLCASCATRIYVNKGCYKCVFYIADNEELGDS